MASTKGAGALNQRITFQRQTSSADDIGNRINTYSDYYTCWAAVSTSKLSTTETNETAQTLEQERLDFTVRYCSQTSEVRSTEYRIIFKERIYDIESVDNLDFARQMLKFSTKLVRR
ncbi:MAG: phage head closure protein [Synergistaceae bacterium]|nr:phage head closure protein [Synergistaceae bacterium]MBR0247585.1 phage head closure protein [Synergistaceae bacterium]